MNNIIMQQCETMIDALENAGISIEVYATEFCNQVALPPLDRCFSELVAALEDKISEENLIAIDTLEQMKWRRYEEWGESEEMRYLATQAAPKYLVQWLEGYGDAPARVVPFSEMLGDDWDLDKDFLFLLLTMQEGQTHSYYDPSGVVQFIKAPSLKGE